MKGFFVYDTYIEDLFYRWQPLSSRLHPQAFRGTDVAGDCAIYLGAALTARAGVPPFSDRRGRRQ